MHTSHLCKAKDLHDVGFWIVISVRFWLAICERDSASAALLPEYTHARALVGERRIHNEQFRFVFRAGDSAGTALSPLPYCS